MKEVLFYLLNRITFTSYLVVVMTFGFFGLVILTIFHPPSEEVRAFVYTTIGGIAGSVSTIVTFKFGSSSHGQKVQDALTDKPKI